MRALIVTSEFYGAANRIGSHHLAAKFATKGIEVFVISFPVSPLYALRPQATHYKNRTRYSTGFQQAEDGVNVYVPKTLVPPLPALVRFLPSILNEWHRLTSPRISDVIARDIGDSVDLVLSDSLFFPFLKQQLACNKLVFRIPDNFQGFWGRNATLSAAEWLQTNDADLIVTSSQLLRKELLEARGIHARFLPNGVDLQKFSAKLQRPAEYSRKGRPRALYIGALYKGRFDAKFLLDVAELRPEWDFFVIGGTASSRQSPRQHNLYFLGERSPPESVAFMQHAHVGIIPFGPPTGPLVRYVHPIKLYEYLAAGIPVVATRWEELELIRAPIMLADSPDEFASMLDQCLSEEISRQSGKRKHFAARFDWENIANSLLSMTGLQ